jgi:hypothetical protein
LERADDQALPWLHAQVKKRFPDPETKLLIACNDGRNYTMNALVALDEEGYTNIAGLKVVLVNNRMGVTWACLTRGAFELGAAAVGLPVLAHAQGGYLAWFRVFDNSTPANLPMTSAQA